MGIAAPLTRASYNATDNVMLLDETEYTTTETSYELQTTKNQIEVMAQDSTLRIKIWIEKDGVPAAPPIKCQCRYYNGSSETTLFTEENPGGYAEFINDISPAWVNGGELRFYLQSVAGRTAKLKDISICGERSPYVG